MSVLIFIDPLKIAKNLLKERILFQIRNLRVADPKEGGEIPDDRRCQHRARHRNVPAAMKHLDALAGVPCTALAAAHGTTLPE